MRFLTIFAAVVLGLAANAAMAQGMVIPMPSVSTTSPLDVTNGTSVGGTGIPLGATEITSAGTSPAPTNPTGTIAIPGSGIPCATLGGAAAGMYGSTATYDGGGLALGTSAPATGMSAGNTALSPDMSSAPLSTSGTSTTSGMLQSAGMSTASGVLDTSGMSGMCGSGSTSVAASSTPTSSAMSSSSMRAGLPLGSTEIGNLGVSSIAPVPTPNTSPYIASLGMVAPAAPVVTAPVVAAPTTAGGVSASTTFSPIQALVPGLSANNALR